MRKDACKFLCLYLLSRSVANSPSIYRVGSVGETVKIWKPQSISWVSVSLNDGRDHLQLNMLTPKTDFILAKTNAVHWRNKKRPGSHHLDVTGALVTETSDCTNMVACYARVFAGGTSVQDHS